MKRLLGKTLRRFPRLFRAAKNLQRSAWFFRNRPFVAARAVWSSWTQAWAQVETQGARVLNVPVADLTELSTLATAAGSPPRVGGHSLYFEPAALRQPVFGTFFELYPDNVGMKVLKNAGPPDSTEYLTRGSESVLRSRVIGRLDQHARAANYLWTKNIAPRIWDVVEIRLGRSVHSAIVMEHIAGEQPSPSAQQAFLDSLAAVLDLGVVDIAVEDWKSHYDFTSKGLADNLVVAKSRNYYVDTQNFFLVRPQAWTEDVIARASDTLHFGDKRGGARLLYQSVPGSKERAKRDVTTRFGQYRAELSKLGIEFSGRVVLDVGCNAGMMMQSALRAGAEWALGWDFPGVAQAANELLMSLGMTRFHIFGKALSAALPLRDDIDVRFRHLMPESIIFYLAVHGHIGLNSDLLSGPWRALLIEGHQGESHDDMKRIVERVAQLAGELDVHTLEIRDGDSLPRPAVVAIRRTGQPRN